MIELILNDAIIQAALNIAALGAICIGFLLTT